MDVRELIDKFEEKAELVKNSVSFKGTYRIIKEANWQKLKKEAMKEYAEEGYFDMGGE